MRHNMGTLAFEAFAPRPAPARVANVPTTPEQIFAHWKTLTGDERLKYYSKNAAVLWEQYHATNR